MEKKGNAKSIILTDIYFSPNGSKSYKVSKVFLILKLISYFSIIFFLIFGLYRYIFNDGDLVLLIVSGCTLIASFVFSIINKIEINKSLKKTKAEIDEFYTKNGGDKNLSLNINHRTFVKINPKTNSVEIYHDLSKVFDVKLNDISSVGYIPDVSKKDESFPVTNIKGISAYSRLTIEYKNGENKKEKASFDLSNYLTVENQLCKETSKSECSKLYKFHRKQIEELDKVITNAKKGIMPIPDKKIDNDKIKVEPNDKRDKIQKKKTPKREIEPKVKIKREKKPEKKSEKVQQKEREIDDKYIKSSVKKPDEKSLDNHQKINVPEDIKKDILKKESKPEKIKQHKNSFDK